MTSRIIGLETEYSLCFWDKKENKLFGAAFVRKEVEEAARELGFFDWLENGGRLYIDRGDHPEYSTPECFSPLDLVKYEKAGERILEKICDLLNSRYEGQGIFYFHKDNSDRKGRSFGCHENYLVRGDGKNPPIWLSESLPILATFLATRQIFCGSGKIGIEPVVEGTNCFNFSFKPYWEQDDLTREPEEDFETDLSCVFQISQRADFISCLVSAAPHGGPKGFFSEKGDSHCLDDYYRLHIICGDSNMSEYSTWLKIATTLAVISMLENGFINSFSVDIPILANPTEAVKEISRDINLKKRFPLKGGSEMSALEIQKWFLRKVIEYHSANLHCEDIDDRLISEWSDTLEKLEKSPESLAEKIDWLMKYKLIKCYAAEKNLDWHDPQILVIDVEYHNIQRNRGFYYFLEQKGKVKRLFDESEIEKAIRNSPAGRPMLRSAFIKFVKKFGLQNFKIDWSNFGRIQAEVEIKDPWNFSYEEAVKFLKCLESIIEEMQFNRKLK